MVITDYQLPIPNSQFPIPQFPIPNSQFPITEIDILLRRILFTATW
ncbi:MAG: hypothetical protein HC894_27400 [Microcoleus sp. SM1_3_4]|nr:hypothetical protein [Microcoleus sp. SM1_3_4]